VKKLADSGKLPRYSCYFTAAMSVKWFFSYLMKKWKRHVQRLPDDYFGATPEIQHTFFWQSDDEGKPMMPDGSGPVPGGACVGVLYNKKTRTWENYPCVQEDQGPARGLTLVGLTLPDFLKIEGTIGWEYPAHAVYQSILHYFGVREWNFPEEVKYGDKAAEDFFRHIIFRGMMNTAFFTFTDRDDGHVTVKRVQESYHMTSKRLFYEVNIFLDWELEKTHKRVSLGTADGKKSLSDYAAASPLVPLGYDGKMLRCTAALVRMASGIKEEEGDFARAPFDKPVPKGRALFLPGDSFVSSTDFKTVEAIAKEFAVSAAMIELANPARRIDGGNAVFDIKPYTKDVTKPLPAGHRIHLPLGKFLKMSNVWERTAQDIIVETYGDSNPTENGSWVYPKWFPVDLFPDRALKGAGGKLHECRENDAAPWHYKNRRFYDEKVPKGRGEDAHWTPTSRARMDPTRYDFSHPSRHRPDQAFELTPLQGLQDASSHIKSILSYYTHGSVHFWSNGTAWIDPKVWKLAPLATNTTQWMNGQAIFLSWFFMGMEESVLSSCLVFNNSNPFPLHHGMNPDEADLFTIGGERSEFHRMGRRARARVWDHIKAQCEKLGKHSPKALDHNLPLTDTIMAGTLWHAADHWYINNCFSQNPNIHATKSDLSGLFYSLVKPIKYYTSPSNNVAFHVNRTKWDAWKWLIRGSEDPICRILWEEASLHNLEFATRALSVGCAF